MDDGKGGLEGLPRRHQGEDDGNMSLEGSCLVVWSDSSATRAQGGEATTRFEAFQASITVSNASLETAYSCIVTI